MILFIDNKKKNNNNNWTNSDQLITNSVISLLNLLSVKEQLTV